ncbi:hypothetical protein SmJEL517_g03869 [Synchytrium microbalum]|uniref:Ubiquitin-like domain-containing protein n=1 Tax=Synchytrium microbalum TaxID=1806994 RepID=A0A507C6S0_9FUNG|nr:uncharacterized protein SmJEL517_g03869 [Synchytrium microbalum]TPX33243.1 hypothetical protein SmJEL517_g03869 [Synchytrium microbalum]
MATSHIATSQIFVKTIQDSKTIAVDFRTKMTVDHLKSKTLGNIGTPTDMQRPIYAGKQLEDGRLLSDYTISKDATLHMVLRLKGGMQRSLRAIALKV